MRAGEPKGGEPKESGRVLSLFTAINDKTRSDPFSAFPTSNVLSIFSFLSFVTDIADAQERLNDSTRLYYEIEVGYDENGCPLPEGKTRKIKVVRPLVIA